MIVTTRDRLIDAAIDLFYRHGYNAVGLGRILDAVGITKTAFYKHFESKDALILAALQKRDRQDIDELLSLIREREQDGPKAQLLALFDLLREWFLDESFRGCMFMNAAIEFPMPNDPIHVLAESHGAHLHSALMNVAEDAGVAEPQELASQLMLLVGGALTARHVSLNTTAADTAHIAAEALIDRYLQSAPLAA